MVDHDRLFKELLTTFFEEFVALFLPDVSAYLELNAREQRIYERQLADLVGPQQESIMELMTSWKREGILEGKREGMMEGKEEMLGRLFRRRFGILPTALETRLHRLSPGQMDDLSEALFDFTSVEDLAGWLANHLEPHS